MKHLFYILLILSSAGTVVAITNPKFAEDTAARFGWEVHLQPEKHTENTAPEDSLGKYLCSPPTVVQNNNVLQTEVPSVYANPVPQAEPAATFDTAFDTALQPTSFRTEPENFNSADAVPVNIPPLNNALNTAAVDPFLENSSVPPSYRVSAPPTSVYDTVNNTEVKVAKEAKIEYSPAAVNTASLNDGIYHKTECYASPNLENTASTNRECYGTETVARVGTQVILMCDILPRMRRYAMRFVDEQIQKMPQEQQEKMPPGEKEKVIARFIEDQYPVFLDEQIKSALVYNDYVMSKPQQERDFLDKRVGEDFDQIEIPQMLKEFNVKDQTKLNSYLKEKLGSSLERERMLWVHDRIAQQWMQAASQQATGECTHEQLRQFYDQNQKKFTTEAKAKWQEMVVLLSKYPNEEAAMKKIRWMGNQAATGAPFEEIAKYNSDGFTASKGGVYDWTSKDSFASPELAQAVFSQTIGELSPAIIRTEKGLHIIRVLDRQEAKTTPFVEAQVTIREQIKHQRKTLYIEEYFTELKRRYPCLVVKERIDFAALSNTIR